jgi:hypothetical protein
MTTASDGAAGTRPSLMASMVKRAVARMIECSPLEVRELDNGLVIFNPQDPDRGQVHIAYADGYVSWERVTWDYWGVLEGFEEAGDATTTVAKIIDTLTAC